MDAVKIIKKHGSPGGLPVVTAYVDADAPGESEKKLYRHDVQVYPAAYNCSFGVTIINDSSAKIETRDGLQAAMPKYYSSFPVLNSVGKYNANGYGYVVTYCPGIYLTGQNILTIPIYGVASIAASSEVDIIELVEDANVDLVTDVVTELG